MRGGFFRNAVLPKGVNIEFNKTMKERFLDRRHFAKQLAAGAGALAAGAGGAGGAFGQERVNPENRPKPLRRTTGREGETVFGTNDRMHVRTSGP